MSMVVKNNMSAINTLNVLNVNTQNLSKNLAKVSSGMKINGAADDASGYAISERMRVQIRSLDQDKANTQNGSSLMKVAEGAVSSTVDILKTLKEKVINAANDTNTDSDRATIQKELDQSIDQINDNANVTFNGKYLVDGSHNNKVTQTTCTMTNQSLDKNATWDTHFTELKNRDGNALCITETDTVTVSFVNMGRTYTTSFEVGSTQLRDIISNANAEWTAKGMAGDALVQKEATSFIGLDASTNSVYTASGENGLTLAAGSSGVNGQIGGITISITDNTGKVNKSANAVLDDFTEMIRAQNESADNAIVLQIGTKASQSIKAGMTDMRAVALGLQGTDGATLSVGTQQKANAAINVLDAAIQKALDQQTTIGSIQSRLEYTASNLTTASENVQSAESVIRDADMAKEMTEYTKNNVLMQAAQSMLAQANQNSSNVLSLLQ